MSTPSSARPNMAYDDTMPGSIVLTGVDNLVGNAAGDILVVEDTGDPQMVAIATCGAVIPLVRVTGHGSSDLTGPAFSPTARACTSAHSAGRVRAWARA